MILAFKEVRKTFSDLMLKLFVQIMVVSAVMMTCLYIFSVPENLSVFLKEYAHTAFIVQLNEPLREASFLNGNAALYSVIDCDSADVFLMYNDTEKSLRGFDMVVCFDKRIDSAIFTDIKLVKTETVGSLQISDYHQMLLSAKLAARIGCDVGATICLKNSDSEIIFVVSGLFSDEQERIAMIATIERSCGFEALSDRVFIATTGLKEYSKMTDTLHKRGISFQEFSELGKIKHRADVFLIILVSVLICLSVMFFILTYRHVHLFLKSRMEHAKTLWACGCSIWKIVREYSIVLAFFHLLVLSVSCPILVGFSSLVNHFLKEIFIIRQSVGLKFAAIACGAMIFFVGDVINLLKCTITIKERL